MEAEAPHSGALALGGPMALGWVQQLTWGQVRAQGEEAELL